MNIGFIKVFHFLTKAKALIGDAVPFLIFNGKAINSKRVGSASRFARFSIISTWLTKKVLCAGILVLPLQSNPKVSVHTAQTFFLKRYLELERSRPGQLLI